jgi:hypothetical protein
MFCGLLIPVLVGLQRIQKRLFWIFTQHSTVISVACVRCINFDFSQFYVCCLDVFIISLSMSLTGLSLEMSGQGSEKYTSLWDNLLVHSYLRFQATDFHKFGLVWKALAHRWFLTYVWPENGTVCARLKKSKIHHHHIIIISYHIISYYI